MLRRVQLLRSHHVALRSRASSESTQLLLLVSLRSLQLLLQTLHLLQLLLLLLRYRSSTGRRRRTSSETLSRLHNIVKDVSQSLARSQFHKRFQYVNNNSGSRPEMKKPTVNPIPEAPQKRIESGVQSTKTRPTPLFFLKEPAPKGKTASVYVVVVPLFG